MRLGPPDNPLYSPPRVDPQTMIINKQSTYRNVISFEAEAIRQYIEILPSWVHPEMQAWLHNEATDTDLTMIGDAISDDDELWDLINYLIAKHTAEHIQARLTGAITDEDIA